MLFCLFTATIRMAGFFHNIAETMQSPMLFEQFGEDVRFSVPGESALDESLPGIETKAIVKVIQSINTDGGQAVILRAEVVLRVAYEAQYRTGPEFPGSHLRDLKTTQTVAIRGQVFAIESIGPISAGTRKIVCIARLGEVTSRSVLSGRL